MNNTINWYGSSRAEYEYTVHELPCRPKEGQDGNYIFAKESGSFWKAVYVGQGDLQQRYDAALHEKCVTSKSATHYHFHLNSDSVKRRNEERDIIAGNSECKWPTGCNGHD